MHQIGLQDLPYGKFRDKGIPIDNVSNFDSTGEQIVYLCDGERSALCMADVCDEAGADKTVRC